jgi:hypothetical protein
MNVRFIDKMWHCLEIKTSINDGILDWYATVDLPHNV